MSIEDCIERAVKAGELDEELGSTFLSDYQKILKRREKSGDLNAKKLAGEEALQEADRLAKKAASTKLNQFLANKALYEHIKDHVTAGSGKRKPEEGGIAQFDNSGIGGKPGVEQIQNEYKNRTYSMLDEFMATQKKNVLGNSSDQQSLANIVNEIFGKDTGDQAAKQMAQAWKQAAEWLRLEYNRAGGDIKFREDWGLPQVHDWKKIAKTHKGSWIDFTYKRLDIEKMSDLYSMTPDEIRKSLDGVYDNISSNGTKDIDFEATGRKMSVYKKKMDSRFLVFRDADKWMEYQETFGNGDPFSVMMGHIDVMARDIAMMKKLGPNTQQGLMVVKNSVKKFNNELGLADSVKLTDEQLLNGTGPKNKNRKLFNDYNETLQDYYDVYSGIANVPKNEQFARFSANTRQVLTAAQLGSAVVSATTDPFFMSLTAAFNGMGIGRVLGRVLKTADSRSHQDMLRLGLNAESWANTAASMARYHDEALSSGFFQKLASGSIRLSGLQYWTDMMRWSFQREFLGFISENAKHSFKDLPSAMQNSLKRYDISSEDWEIIRATKQYDLGNGALYLRSQDIARRTDLTRRHADELSLKMATLMDNETNFAVPTATMKARRAFGHLGQAGSVWGEFKRSGLMYKSFPLFLMMTHMRRGIDEAQNGRFGYAAIFLLGTTVFGGLATQLKEMKDGKQPSQMFDENWVPDNTFWIRALLQGGGLGIFGDFAIKDHTRYGQSKGETIAGPAIAAIDDAAAIVQNLGEAAILSASDGAEAKRKVYKAAEGASHFLPAKSIWWASPLIKRGIQDNLKAMGSKNPRRKLKRMIKDRQKKNNSGYWWEPGEVVPF